MTWHWWSKITTPIDSLLEHDIRVRQHIPETNKLILIPT